MVLSTKCISIATGPESRAHTGKASINMHQANKSIKYREK